MKKIAIFACGNANDVCAGVSCLDALDERRAYFEKYTGEPVKLCAFLRCSHCGINPEEDPGMMEKLERISCCGVETVHVGVCARRQDGTICPYMEKAVEWIKKHGVQIVWGTH